MAKNLCGHTFQRDQNSYYALVARKPFASWLASLLAGSGCQPASWLASARWPTPASQLAGQPAGHLTARANGSQRGPTWANGRATDSGSDYALTAQNKCIGPLLKRCLGKRGTPPILTLCTHPHDRMQPVRESTSPSLLERERSQASG